MLQRYFIEVAYKGTNYAGFQIQQNANTIHAEVQKALEVYFRRNFELTGSSRTDAGVHALQNYFHFDTEYLGVDKDLAKSCYHLNAILPSDIVINSIHPVSNSAHCRFDAVSRTYQYTVYQYKNPFLDTEAYYYPYKLDIALLNAASDKLLQHTDFKSFAKKNIQVSTFDCSILESKWHLQEDRLIYKVTGNRFLRGMVRGLVGTMLTVGTSKIALSDFIKILDYKDSSLTDFSAPAKGLCLQNVIFPDNFFA